MPMWERRRRQRRRASEFFYYDDQNQRQDADLHNPILSEGDDAAALAVSEAVRKRILGDDK
jgi:hypothetical protein